MGQSVYDRIMVYGHNLALTVYDQIMVYSKTYHSLFDRPVTLVASESHSSKGGMAPSNKFFEDPNRAIISKNKVVLRAKAPIPNNRYSSLRKWPSPKKGGYSPNFNNPVEGG